MSMKIKGFQNHHCIYGKPGEELTVYVKPGEHWPISRLERYTKQTLSEGFMLAMEFLILKHKIKKYNQRMQRKHEKVRKPRKIK